MVQAASAAWNVDEKMKDGRMKAGQAGFILPPTSFLCSCYKVPQQRVKLTAKQNIQLAARSKSQDTNELFAFAFNKSK